VKIWLATSGRSTYLNPLPLQAGVFLEKAEEKSVGDKTK